MFAPRPCLVNASPVNGGLPAGGGAGFLLDPLVPVPLVVFLALVLGGFTVWVYQRTSTRLGALRRGVLLGFRLTGLALVLLIHLQPSRQEPLPAERRDQVVLEDHHPLGTAGRRPDPPERELALEHLARERVKRWRRRARLGRRLTSAGDLGLEPREGVAGLGGIAQRAVDLLHLAGARVLHACAHVVAAVAPTPHAGQLGLGRDHVAPALDPAAA